MSLENMTEMEKIRHFANISGECRESVWDDLTRAECFRVFDAWMASGWDFYPDQWTRAQFTDAIRYGIAPDWRQNETPITYEATHKDIIAIDHENNVARVDEVHHG